MWLHKNLNFKLYFTFVLYEIINDFLYKKVFLNNMTINILLI